VERGHHASVRIQKVEFGKSNADRGKKPADCSAGEVGGKSFAPSGAVTRRLLRRTVQHGSRRR
jgi:hypothetical protein